jgi:hypothetical protein
MAVSRSTGSHRPVRHHARDPARVGDVAKRVGVEQDEVGAGARTDPPRVLVAVEQRRVAAAAGERLQRGEPRGDEVPHLVVDREARDDREQAGVGAGEKPFPASCSSFRKRSWGQLALPDGPHHVGREHRPTDALHHGLPQPGG